MSQHVVHLPQLEQSIAARCVTLEGRVSGLSAKAIPSLESGQRESAFGEPAKKGAERESSAPMVALQAGMETFRLGLMPSFRSTLSPLTVPAEQMQLLP